MTYDARAYGRSMIIVAIVALLSVQFAISAVLGEPYPAIRYPAFQQVYAEHGWIIFSDSEAVVCIDSEKHPIELEVLFSPLPQSFIPEVLRGIRKDSSNNVSSATEVRRVEAANIAFRLRSHERNAELVTWFREKVEAIYGVSGEKAEVVIRSYRRKIPASNPDQAAAATLTSVLHIDLRDKASTMANSSCVEESA